MLASIIYTPNSPLYYISLSLLSCYELPKESWKEFVLNTLFQYNRYDEVVIFIRTSGIRWDELHYARKHIVILLKYGKPIQAYNFVTALIQHDSIKKDLSDDFKQIFYFFITNMINENLVSYLYTLIPF